MAPKSEAQIRREAERQRNQEAQRKRNRATSNSRRSVGNKAVDKARRAVAQASSYWSEADQLDQQAKRRRADARALGSRGPKRAKDAERILNEADALTRRAKAIRAKAEGALSAAGVVRGHVSRYGRGGARLTDAATYDIAAVARSANADPAAGPTPSQPAAQAPANRTAGPVAPLTGQGPTLPGQSRVEGSYQGGTPQVTEDGRGSVTAGEISVADTGSGGEGGPTSSGATEAAAAPSAASGTIEDQVRQNYGHLAWLLEIPEIREILLKATQEGWNADRLTGAVYATNWWKTTAPSAREWIKLTKTDPASAAARIDAAQESLRNEFDRLGVKVSETRLREMAENSLKMGQSPAQVQAAIGGEITYINVDRSSGRAAFVGPNGEPGYDPNDANKPAGGQVATMNDGRLVYFVPGAKPANPILTELGAVVGGSVGPLRGRLADTATQARALAAQYGIRLSDQTLGVWIDKITEGAARLEDFESELRTQAKVLFPALASQIDRGITVAQATEPYRQAIASTLGLNPAAIDFTDPKWNRFLGMPDKDGNRKMADVWEVETELRTNPIYGWGNTKGAKDMAHEFGANLLRDFGVVRD